MIYDSAADKERYECENIGDIMFSRLTVLGKWKNIYRSRTCDTILVRVDGFSEARFESRMMSQDQWSINVISQTEMSV
jgi:hypothetical protein